MGCNQEKDTSKRKNRNQETSDNKESQEKINPPEPAEEISNNPEQKEKEEIKEVKDDLPKPNTESLENNDNEEKKEKKEKIEIVEQIQDSNNNDILRNAQSPPSIRNSQNENPENDKEKENEREKEKEKEKEIIVSSTNEKPAEETEHLAENENLHQSQIRKEFVEARVLYGHSEKVTAIIQLNSGKLVTGGYDNKIRVWDIYDISKNNEDKIIDEEGRVFVLLEFEDGKILSGTSKNRINLWDLNSDSTECDYSFEGHELWVNCLVKIDNKRFASASNVGLL